MARGRNTGGTQHWGLLHACHPKLSPWFASRTTHQLLAAARLGRGKPPFLGKTEPPRGDGRFPKRDYYRDPSWVGAGPRWPRTLPWDYLVLGFSLGPLRPMLCL